MPTANPATTPEGSATPIATLATVPRMSTMRPIRRKGPRHVRRRGDTTAAAIATRIAG
jgi:hypothetical protein